MNRRYDRYNVIAMALIILCLAAFWFGVIYTAISIASPRPDPAPSARHHHRKVTMLPLCPYIPGLPSGWWTIGTNNHGQVICIGPNRPHA